MLGSCDIKCFNYIEGKKEGEKRQNSPLVGISTRGIADIIFHLHVDHKLMVIAIKLHGKLPSKKQPDTPGHAHEPANESSAAISGVSIIVSALPSQQKASLYL